MIQRVQSLYLLCAIIFMAVFAFMPYFNITADNISYQLTSMGITTTEIAETEGASVVSSQNYTVAILSGLIIIMSIIAVFLYKNRVKQTLVCKINILFYITLYIVMAINAYTNYTALQGTAFATTSYVVFPICALITNWLAINAINKDEKMVRDSDRMWTRSK